MLKSIEVFSVHSCKYSSERFYDNFRILFCYAQKRCARGDTAPLNAIKLNILLPNHKFPTLRWLPTIAGLIYIDQCEASLTDKCFKMNDTREVVF